MPGIGKNWRPSGTVLKSKRYEKDKRKIVTLRRHINSTGEISYYVMVGGATSLLTKKKVRANYVYDRL